MLYYIINPNKSHDSYAMFWRPRGEGYTVNIYDAGTFTENEIKAMTNPDLIFVPISVVALRDVICVLPIDTVLAYPTRIENHNAH